MKSITLNKIEINNFKGISSLSIDFAKVTNIKGENVLGKTSIFDAFHGCYLTMSPTLAFINKNMINSVNKREKEV
ncbi:DUF2813 domain-containing protein [Terrisporobacter petrolearius]|uniref:DUF2813 domain-containing protein n=1 Tax=Terrisporobacter petrolearius TaxID=1460447 RepID=UPI001D161C4E|nr:DUF2813 domain-containing protein [Terrisporobacter petrolearius]